MAAKLIIKTHKSFCIHFEHFQTIFSVKSYIIQFHIPKVTIFDLCIVGSLLYREKRQNESKNNTHWPVSLADAFVSGARGLRFNSRTDQIGHGIAVVTLIEMNCVARAQ